MKRFITAAILAALLLSFAGCRDATEGPASTSADHTAQTTNEKEPGVSGDETASPVTTETAGTTDAATTDGADETTAMTTAETEEPVTEAPYVRPPDYPSGIYTTEQLNSIDNTGRGWGPGVNADAQNRPYGATSAQDAYGKYNSVFIMPETDPAYLTFDLGYEYKDLTGTILDILKEKGVKGTFFVTMDYVARNPGYVRRIIDEGHILGNHSANHKVMHTLSVADMESEIMTLHNYVKENFGYDMYLFRPPSGEFSERVLAVAENLGYKNVFWSFAYVDWDTANQPDVASAYARVTGSAHKGAVYLLHGVSETNVAILPDAIDFLKAGVGIANSWN